MAMSTARCAGSLCAIALGLFAIYMTQFRGLPNSASMQKVQTLCFAGNATAVKEAGLHEYVPWMGGGFICLLTQFALAIAEEPAGMIVWGVAATLLFPIMLLMFTEAGRLGAKGSVRWPIFVFLMGQIFGISFSFPCIWVSDALREDTGKGPPSVGRVCAAALVPLIISCFEVAVFSLDTHTRAWTLCADVMVGPGLAVLGVITWPFPCPDKPDLGGLELLKKVYTAFAVLSAAGYYYLISYAWRTFASFDQLLGALWGSKASCWVAFMTVDSSVLCLSMLVYLAASCRSRDVLLAVLCSPLIGPAAAYCAVLRAREQQRGEAFARGGLEALLPS